jgi:hypothetical protein
METIAHDGSGGGQSRRWGQAFAVVGGGGEAMGNREGSRGSSGNPEHQLRPGLATSPAKRVSCVPSMFDSLGVQVPCMRAKRKGVVARRGLKEAWSEAAT